MSVLRPSARDAAAAASSGFIHGGGFVYRRSEARDDREPDAQLDRAVCAAMDRVAVMRVFDFEGLMDAVLEVRQRLQGAASSCAATAVGSGLPSAGARDRQEPKQDVVVGRDQLPDHDSTTGAQHAPSPGRTREIPDSQAEDSDDEMLLDRPLQTAAAGWLDKPSAPHDLPQPDAPPAPCPPLERAPADAPSQPQASSPPAPGPAALATAAATLLILPSVGALLAPQMAANHVRAHALLVHLQRQLAALTRSHAAACLLLNTVVPLATGAEGPDGAPGARAREETPSAFARVRVKPALGRTYDGLLDVSCLVTAQRGSGTRERRHVFEVLHDREGDWTGRWCIFNDL